MAVPEWVAISAGIFFIVAIVLNVALLIAVVVLVTKVMPLVTELRGQVHTIGEKVKSITTNAQQTVEQVHNKTTQIMGGAEEASAEVTRKVSAASAAITALFVVTRLVGVIRGMGGGTPQHKRAKA